MIHRILLSLVAIFFCSVAFAQEPTTPDSTQTAPTDTVAPTPPPPPTPPAEPEKPKKDKAAGNKIYYGGNVGMSFGSYTMIGVYPMIGYKLTPKLSAGVTFNYQWIRDKRFDGTYETSNYGASVFARYRVIPAFYLHAEYLGQNYELYNADGMSERIWVPFFLVGGGVSKMISRNTWFNAQILVDVLDDSNSPYRSWEPWYSVGIGVGF